MWLTLSCDLNLKYVCLSLSVLPIDYVGCVWNSREGKEKLVVMILINVEMARLVESRL